MSIQMLQTAQKQTLFGKERVKAPFQEFRSTKRHSVSTLDTPGLLPVVRFYFVKIETNQGKPNFCKKGDLNERLKTINQRAEIASPPQGDATSNG
jgi:hypothetical protein